MQAWQACVVAGSMGGAPWAYRTPISVRTKSLPLRVVWNAWEAWPGQSQTVTR